MASLRASWRRNDGRALHAGLVVRSFRRYAPDDGRFSRNRQRIYDYAVWDGPQRVLQQRGQSWFSSFAKSSTCKSASFPRR